jgi:hypothetical protein
MSLFPPPGSQRTRINLVLHEALGGHTIERHVGKSGAWLIQRINGDPTIQAATTFGDLTTAEASVNAVLDANRERVTEWLASRARMERLDHDLNTCVGIGIRRIPPLGILEVSHLTEVRFILQRLGPDAPLSFLVLTAFPIG